MPTKKQMKAQQKAIANSNKKQEKLQQNSGGLIDLGKEKKPSWRKSTNDQFVRVPKYNEQQQPVLDLITQYLQGKNGLQGTPLGGLNLPGSQQNSFTPIKNEAIRRFEEEGVPSIAARFQSLGNRDLEPGPHNSALYKMLGSGRRQLESQLAALEAQYGLQNQQQQSGNLFNLLGAGLGSQYDVGNIPGQNSAVRQTAIGGANLGLNYLTGGGLGGLFGGRQQQGSSLGNNQGNQQQIYQNTAGFNNQQGIGFGGQQQGLGIQGINNSILQGYGDQLLPQNNNFQF